MNYEVTTAIDAPREAVWQTLLDVELWPQWTPSVRRVQVLGGTGADGLTVGTRARIKQPRLPVALWRVTEVDPGRSFTWQAHSPGLTTIGGHRLDTRPDGSTVSVHSLRLAGALAPLARLTMSGMIRRSLQLEADGLKRRCEGR